MDWFDPIVAPRGPARKLTPAENAAAMICLVAFPVVDLCLLFTDLSKRPDIAMLWMPGIFTAAAIVVCVALRVHPWRAFTIVLGCLWWCFVASTTMVVIDILIFPF
jgi:hypothetical protein